MDVLVTGADSGQPRAPISAAGLQSGCPPGCRANRPLAIANPALNAESTAAAAIDCQRTIAARGARIGQSERANSRGTGPVRAIARTVKARADTAFSLT